VEDFYKAWPPKKNALLKMYFQLWEPRPSEFFMGIWEKELLITNQRLFLNDRKKNQYTPIELSMIQNYESEGKRKHKCSFQLSNGEEVVVEKMKDSLNKAWLNSRLVMKVWLWEDGKPPSS